MLDNTLRTGLAVAIAATLAACTARDAVDLSAVSALSTPTAVGAAPNFAVAPSGATAAAWVSAPGGGTDGRLYVATNGTPSELRDSLGPVEAHGESPPKIAYGADGSLNALYVVAKVIPGRRFPAAALRFVRSIDAGKTWSTPVTVTDDSVFGSHNFHALHVAQDGSLYASWLDGRQGKSATYMTRSTDGGKTWAPNTRVAAGESCPCCRTAIATDTTGALYIAWRQVFPGNVRDIVVARSADRGTTWDEPVRVHADQWVFPGCPHAGPSMQIDAKERLNIAWWTGKEGMAGVYYARSADAGRTWSTPVALGTAQFSRPSHVQLAVAPSGKIIVAWDDGTLKTPQIVVRVSQDGGETFGGTQHVSEPGRFAEFPVLGIAGTRVTIAWSEQSAEAVAKMAPEMDHNSKAPKGLHAIGESKVMVRSGALD
jgi:hypothetical protein